MYDNWIGLCISLKLIIERMFVFVNRILELMFYFLLYHMENVCAHPGEAIVSDAKVFVISPVSNNSFIESVRLRSMRNAL